MKQYSPLESRVRELTPEEVRVDLTPLVAELGIETTDEVEPFTGEGIGQQRAVEAIKTGIDLSSKHEGYNLLITGPGGGKDRTTKAILEKYGKKPEKVQDICWVNDFDRVRSVASLYLEPGHGKQLKADMETLVEQLLVQIPTIKDDERVIEHETNYLASTAKMIETLEANLTPLGVRINNEGHIEPLKRIMIGGGMIDEQAERDYLTQRKVQTQHLLDKHNETMVRGRNEFIEQRTRLIKEMAGERVGGITDAFKSAYTEECVISYLTKLNGFVTENFGIFLTKIDMMGRQIEPTKESVIKEMAFQVLVVDDNSNADNSGPKVVVVENVTINNIFGRQRTYVETGQHVVKGLGDVEPGSIIKAKGGYYVLKLEDVLRQPHVWNGLRNAIGKKRVEVKAFHQEEYIISAVDDLKIDDVDISDVTFVMVGGPQILDEYLRSHPLEKEFIQEHFKIVSEFGNTAPLKELLQSEGIKEDSETYVALLELVGDIRSVVDKEKLLPVDRSGIAATLEYQIRLAGDQEKVSLSLGTGGVADTLIEANLAAERDGSTIITRKHVEAALESRHKRTSRLEDAIREVHLEDMATIDLRGEKVGHAHALSVYTTHGDLFCVPTKATAVTSTGKDGVIDIMEEVHLAGEIYQFGMEELKGYIDHVFGQGPAVAFKGKIVKEESYGGIEGNSSSALNTVVLLSRLSGVPIIQRGAMTGGISQTGQVVPIGAESVKVEGFYDACKATGILDEYDDAFVIVPEKNMKGLQLRPDVVEAVRDGKFHVYAVDRIEDAVELLTRVEPGAVHDEVADTVTITRDKNSVYARAAKKLGHYTKMAKK